MNYLFTAFAMLAITTLQRVRALNGAGSTEDVTMPDTTHPAPPTLAADQEALLTQLVTGPSIREVATRALQPALDALYPQLAIDPRLAMVVTPTWTFHDQQPIPGPRHFESLTDALVRHGVASTPAVFLDGEHYLTFQPEQLTPVQLPVSIAAIARLINALAPLLFVAFEDQQLDYWNQFGRSSTARWQELSRSLRGLWNVQVNPDWSDEQLAMARSLFQHPDKSTRAALDTYGSRACLIDLDSVSAGVSTHLNMLDMAVLIGTHGNRTLILTHSITQGFQTYDSLEALGESLRSYMGEEFSADALHWRLIEPEGNYFNHLACNLIALQADAIGALAADPATPKPDLAPHISRSQSALDPTDKLTPSRFNRIEHALPDWMANASPIDLTAYSRHLMDLATVQQQNAGKSFQDGIKPIRQFAVDALRAAMLQQHADAATLELADLEIVVDSVVVWGSFTPLVEPERTRLSLVDLALQNLIALPLGNKTVRSKSAAVLPQWLTVSYLEALIVSVDIGQSYPALIRRTLQDDPLQSLQRQNLFTSHLRIELPLLALQHKIRRQAGIDERGYRYVAAMVQPLESKRWVDGQEIVIRPLAFKPGWRVGSSTDEVANMFVIGPRQMDQGPCLLYRPLLDHALSQFPSPANLIYAIQHSPALRQSVLAWLPDGVRADYANYALTGDRPTVWSLSQLLGDPLTSLQMSGPLTLGAQVVSGDYLTHLYRSNVNALVELAQRQSVSNAQSRWDSFKHGAWMILNAALPFLGKTVGTAAWIWQVLDDLQQTLDAVETSDTERQKTAMTDLLLTLAMVLAHRASSRKPTARVQQEKASVTEAIETPEKPHVSSVVVVRKPDIIGEQPAQHRTSVASDVVLDLRRTLDRFAVSKPEPLTRPTRTTGAYRHLQQHAQRYYAAVGERWFEVDVEEGSDVSIIDSRQQPPLRGPTLIHDKNGAWFVDTRLRLRGGGLPSRLKAMQLENQKRIATLKQQLAEFDQQRALARTELTAAHNALKNAVGDEALQAAQTRFLEKLEQRTQEYAAPIEQLKSLNSLETVANYRTAMVEMLGTQLFFNQTWLDQRNATFKQTLRTTLTLLEAPQRVDNASTRATYRAMVDLCEEMIGKIEFAHSRLQELNRLGRSAAEMASTYRDKLPTFKADDLKALQVSLAAEVCLSEAEGSVADETRLTFERLLESTDLAIQTSRELMQEEGAWALDERIEGLNGLLEQFSAFDQSFDDFASSHASALLEQPFKALRKRVSGFQQDAESHLGHLLREQLPQAPRPGPSKPAATAHKRVIKTRFRGTVVGEIRPAAPGQPILLDVKAPMTGNVIATFHEKTPGVWLERVTSRRRPASAPITSFETQLTQGRTLLEGVDHFIRQTEANAKKPGRIPVEIDEQFQYKADQLDSAAKALEQAQNRSNATAQPEPLIAALNQARNRLNQEGYRIRVEMLKRQPPTAARVEWLLGKNEIDIVSAGDRRRLKGSRKDYLKEYEVRERRTGNVLWYAHFHYASADAANDAFTAAHLKLPEQRLLAGAFDAHAASSTQMIAIYRSAISPQLARSLFFA